MQLVDMNAKFSVSLGFKLFELFLVSLVCWVIARHPDQPSRWRPHWAFLSAMFFCMSFDEAACTHQLIGRVVTEKFHGHGLFYYGFAFPGAVLALCLFIFMLGFLGSLPKKIAAGMILSGFLYVLGAAGVDAVLGAFVERFDLGQHVYSNWDQFAVRLMTDIEGLLQMGSMILYLKTLFDYLRFIGGKDAVDCVIRLEF